MAKKKKKTKEWNETIDDLENYEHEDCGHAFYMFRN